MIRLAIRCRPEHAEAVLAELLELAPGGVEEDASNPAPPRELWGDDDGREEEAQPPVPDPDAWVEYAIYGAPGELPELPDLRAVAGDAPIEIETTEIPDDWADRWRDFHEPILVADRLLVRPSWREASEAPSAEIDIVIDPGQAFGTGAHATTRLSLELLVALADAGEARGALLDLGSGSGVLAIAAGKLGWAPVRGLDHEPAAVAAATSNAELNDVDAAFERHNLREVAPPRTPTVVANLTAPLLRIVAGHWTREPSLTPDRLVCSGMLAREADEVVAAFDACGLEVRQRDEQGDWAALSLAAR